ncbi:hypothetical protein [Bradyrhizobium sp. USDA 3311]
MVLPGLGRKDGLGEMAEAEMLKLRAIEKVEAELDAKAEQYQAAAERRKIAITRVAGEFEASVAQVVETVSAAST